MIWSPISFMGQGYLDLVLASLWVFAAMYLEHGDADRTSVVLAFAGTVSLVLAGIELSILPLMALYSIVAIYILKKRKTAVYRLFNARAYNALLFIITLVPLSPDLQVIITSNPIVNVTWVDHPLVTMGIVLGLWVPSLIVVYLLSWAMKKPRKKRLN
jgi:hypothetical protein